MTGEALLPKRPAIDGLTFRTYRDEEDLPAIVELLKAAYAAYGEQVGISVEEMAVQTANRDRVTPEEDMVLGFVGHELVGRSYLDWMDTPDGCQRQYQHWGDVHPGWRRRGIGTAMWQRNVDRLTALAAAQGFDGERALVVPVVRGGDAGGEALAECFGYRRTRVYKHMTRPTLADIEAPALPDGLEIRPITDELMRVVFDGGIEAFRDHHGTFDASEAGYREWLDSPSTRAELIVAAFEGAEIAGAVHAEIHDAENEQQGYRRGWTDPIWVRRPWRRRGLASALLGRALLVLRDHGMTSAQLDVDSENPNEAFALYERHGFVADRIASEWQKALPSQGARIPTTGVGFPHRGGRGEGNA